MSKFTHLHLHSHYSLLDGLPKIDEILDYIKSQGMDSVALTDHGVLYGAVEFYKKAKARGIKPIIGCEVYQAFEKMEQKRPNIDNKRYHLILLVKNEEGYKNLVKLVTEAHLKGFYYKPRVDDDLLSEHSQGLIALSACLQGKIPQLILGKKIKEAEKTARKYQEIFGKDNFYLELQHHPGIPEQEKVNKVLISFSKKLNIPLVATNDCHYLRKDDAEVQDILMLINTGSDPNDPERLTMKADDFSVREPQEMIKDFKDVPEAIYNTQKIAERCNFEFKLGEVKLPYYPLPEEEEPNQYLKKLCYQGIEKRELKKDKEIIDRLEDELSVIKKTGFAPYFLIVQDFVNWAKENRIVVGPGRGSAGGSLVAYLLNITNINPLKYNLLFERFLNPGRTKTLPDIDLDFTDRRRDEVINYVAQKYGRDKVAQIITFGTMASRAVVRDVGRALNYNYSFCDKIAKLIPFGYSLDETLAKIREFRELYQSDPKIEKLVNFAKKLEGCARHASTHACGVVISKEPLDEIVPLQFPTQNDQNIVTQYEMHAIEDLGLLKMDFLGLKNLTIIEDTLNKIYAIRHEKVDIENIPLDDKQAYKLLQKGDCIGVFQLESEGMRRYLKQLKPTEFEDIIAMVALYRPGPMALIPDYIAGKYKKKKVEYLHPKLKSILESTFGIPVYQEQVMKIAQGLAGFTLTEADVLRKAMGKKIKSLLLAQKKKFIEGCKKNEIPESISQKIWHWFEPFAHYSFNRSHAAAYATIAYQTAYLKVHYTLEFMASLLTSEKANIERIGFLMEECKRMGIEVLPPNLNESFRYFSVIPKENKIRFGLAAIKNVGENVVEEIVKERKEKGHFQSIEDFVSRVPIKVLNKKSLESLIKTGTFDKFGERKKLLNNLELLLEYSRESKKNKFNGQKGLFDGLNKNCHKTAFKLMDSEKASQIEKLRWEKELLGIYVSGHPLDNFKKNFWQMALPINQITHKLVGKTVKVCGVISGIKKIITKTGKPMLFFNLEDKFSKIEVVNFPSVIERNPEAFQENKIVLVSGRIDNKDDTPKLICETIEEIIEK
ncbi:MAG: DNA polymerase III subunit alpha [Candidatus Nealsonbacteria bacterium CG_4_9_14_3_um_filter_35_11]|uniref:DNA polymerase III subunit alpha n=2 Tax=Candidatus Nealsoniibacteriota TaxID=1817911 RepID=A0A2M7DAW3_9BACT|nr:MAG: DNA polymerase III subunit alpha [Candidatus Nealsonbacteria bacterium CG11_big_fil_rev_8_21_14_0_20_35_11]PIV45570.1 MAG: DNA polymerase III subunit alpha [Candidatus Nealsonbacteria bacterium CG02_land_8_20_14_3_00_34_20]PIZ89865.1 MAG: DNA polymerase III subunit alpha [Candidatus Nealsonbacteria bacterium CG_4_10_14_0_2_um_filter_35_20]PJA84913.1 MAG: DNA polymerase III subunit alpha [Candidatus Nealsonbacteria bacterium CG_4_9_14_3_um_filter_35_11]